MLHFTQKLQDCGDAAATLTLPWSQRIKSRQRVCLDNGTDAGLFLERGIVLRNGDCLAAEDGTIVRIKAALETVSLVRCDDSLLLARICYHLGNRHVDLEISDLWVRYPHDHVLDKMIEALGLEVEVEQAPFEPESGAYFDGQGGHHHEHP